MKKKYKTAEIRVFELVNTDVVCSSDPEETTDVSTWEVPGPPIP